MEITKENYREMISYECVVVNDFYGLGENRKGFISAIDLDKGFTISDLETEKDLFCVNNIVEHLTTEDKIEIFLHDLNIIFNNGKICYDDYKDHPVIIKENSILKGSGYSRCAFK